MFNKEKLRAYLEDNVMSQSELARRLGVTEGTVRHILVGIKQPSFYMACVLADLMGVTLDSLRTRGN